MMGRGERNAEVTQLLCDGVSMEMIMASDGKEREEKGAQWDLLDFQGR